MFGKLFGAKTTPVNSQAKLINSDELFTIVYNIVTPF